MQTLKNIKTRRSVRKYKDDPVKLEQVYSVLEAAMYAPSSGNSQGWEFIVVRDSSKKEELTDIYYKNEISLKAPVSVIVCYDLNKQKFSDRWPVDSAAAAAHMLLAAHDLGLGALWIEVYPDKFKCDGIRLSFKMPENVVPFCIICLGYPAEKIKPIDRFDMEKIHFETW